MALFRKESKGDFNMEYPSGEKRFIKIYSQGMVDGIEIWVDQVTGVNYLYHYSGHSGGLTLLVDREGRPIISTRQS